MEQNTSTARSLGSSLKRGLRNFILIVVGVFVAVMLFLYHGSYSEGVRSGVVIKVSKRGMLFKTWEGQMNLQSFGAVDARGNAMNEVFSFSVEGGQDSLLRELESVSLSGERVNLHYVERYARLPWRGETTYFVTRIERSGKAVDIGRSPYAH